MLADAAVRLVTAINDKRLTELAVLMPEAMAGDLGRRERFIKLIKDFGPRASLGTVEGMALAEACIFSPMKLSSTLWLSIFSARERSPSTPDMFVSRGPSRTNLPSFVIAR